MKIKETSGKIRFLIKIYSKNKKYENIKILKYIKIIKYNIKKYFTNRKSYKSICKN